jgi:hypothetical protein
MAQPLTGRQREACSAKCRAALSRRRRTAGHAQALAEARAAFADVRRLAEIALARLDHRA